MMHKFDILCDQINLLFASKGMPSCLVIIRCTAQGPLKWILTERNGGSLSISSAWALHFSSKKAGERKEAWVKLGFCYWKIWCELKLLQSLGLMFFFKKGRWITGGGGWGGGSLLYWHCINILCDTRNLPYSSHRKMGVCRFRATQNFQKFKVAFNPH